MSRFRVRSAPARIDPPSKVWVPFLVGMVDVTAAGFDPDHPPPGETHAVVERDDPCGLPRRLEVRANLDATECAGDRLLEVMADLVATGGVEGEAVFFTGAFAEARPLRDVQPDAFVRRFLNVPFDSLDGARFSVDWGPLIPPGHMAAELETVRLRLDNPHRDAVLELLAAHGRRNPAEAVAHPVRADGSGLSVLPFSTTGQAFVFHLYQAVLATLLDFHQAGELDDAHLSERASIRVERRWRDGSLPVPATWEQAIDTALHLVNTATAGFAPRLQLVDERTKSAWAGHALPTILPTLCTQLIRSVSLDAPWRECATCRSYFTPTRSNQIYCPDARCGHTMAKRRARERARGAASKSGH